VQHLPRIRALNYQVIVDERLDYDTTHSNYTSRQSADSRSRSSATASPRLKSDDLNNLHMDRAALSPVFHREENENAALSLKNSFQKHRIKNGKKNHHHNIGTKYKNE
jgi:hypothetical protein